ncbi:MAG TPA: polynucleotide adenylyltransferase, partial [Ruminococcaceae bacterium]|nr:polynucleotide adenylyltransferase [Oscillospiraceae bacterium]
ELVGLHGITVSPDEKAVKRRLNKTGEKIFRLLLKVKEADTKAKSPVCFNQLCTLEETEKTLDRVTGEKECFTQKDLAVNGFDLMSAGFSEGKGIGDTLRSLLDAVIDGKCENTREELLKYAEKYKKQ